MAMSIFTQSDIPEITWWEIDFFGLGDIPPYVNMLLVFILFSLLYLLCRIMTEKITKYIP